MPRGLATRALVLGLAGALAILAVLFPFNDRVDLSVPALLLLLPVVGASVFGGWKAATPVAVFAAVGYAFGYVPPVGDIRPHVGRDVVTLMTFVGVGLAVGVIAQRGEIGARPASDRLLDERRAQLLRSVGHDLRNPLHTIQAVTSGLMSSAEDERSRRSLATVAAESERLDRIVANMLNASRIEAGALLPAQAPEHLAALTHTTVARLASSVAQAIEVDVPGDLPDVSVDAVQFDQVLTNLVENAALHGKPDGEIVVTARTVFGFVALTVLDNGPGFTAEELEGPVAFRAGATSPGTGLGLVVCRGIAEAHGGTLRVANRPVGGAEVTITLPVA